ncbi:MAG TPA: hypothetical protein VJ864_17055 [Candidatus Binatia bacterium]|nr:hypothetical protein [Candidatus Binatia bacterium]
MAARVFIKLPNLGVIFLSLTGTCQVRGVNERANARVQAQRHTSTGADSESGQAAGQALSVNIFSVANFYDVN